MTIGANPLASAPIGALGEGSSGDDEAWVVVELTSETLGVVVLDGVTLRLEE